MGVEVKEGPETTPEANREIRTCNIYAMNLHLMINDWTAPGTIVNAIKLRIPLDAIHLHK